MPRKTVDHQKTVDHRGRIVDAALRPCRRARLARGQPRRHRGGVRARSAPALRGVPLEGGDPRGVPPPHRRGGAGGVAEESEQPRDRLFDVMMRRFDALKPHKPAIQAMARDAWSDPLATLCSAPSLRRSMAWMLESCGVPTTGWPGRLRVNLLLGIYLFVLRVWLVDESADMMKTMAALDSRLRQSERWFGLARGDGTRTFDTASSA